MVKDFGRIIVEVNVLLGSFFLNECFVGLDLSRIEVEGIDIYIFDGFLNLDGESSVMLEVAVSEEQQQHLRRVDHGVEKTVNHQQYYFVKEERDHSISPIFAGGCMGLDVLFSNGVSVGFDGFDYSTVDVEVQ